MHASTDSNNRGNEIRNSHQDEKNYSCRAITIHRVPAFLWINGVRVHSAVGASLDVTVIEGPH